jgi:hypothetical protein
MSLAAHAPKSQLTLHRAIAGPGRNIWKYIRGPVAEVSTRELCKAFYPGSNPGWASIPLQLAGLSIQTRELIVHANERDLERQVRRLLCKAGSRHDLPRRQLPRNGNFKIVNSEDGRRAFGMSPCPDGRRKVFTVIDV